MSGLRLFTESSLHLCIFAGDVAHQKQRLLEEFDLDYTFGPSNGEGLQKTFPMYVARLLSLVLLLYAVGISRLMRWERAKRLGLNPPQEVKQIIQQLASSDSTSNERYSYAAHVK